MLRWCDVGRFAEQSKLRYSKIWANPELLRTWARRAAASAHHNRGVSGEFQMNELKHRIANYGVTFAAGLICYAVVFAARAPIAHAQTTTNVLTPPTSPTSTANPNAAPSNISGPAFFEDFKTPTSYKERFDYGWSGEWNAGSMFGADRNDWHADHGMMCGNPNSSHRTIHLTSQQQAGDAAYLLLHAGRKSGQGSRDDDRQHGGLRHRLVLTEADLSKRVQSLLGSEHHRSRRRQVDRRQLPHARGVCGKDRSWLHVTGLPRKRWPELPRKALQQTG